jgi:hypothetical protein
LDTDPYTTSPTPACATRSGVSVSIDTACVAGKLLTLTAGVPLMPTFQVPFC